MCFVRLFQQQGGDAAHGATERRLLLLCFDARTVDSAIGKAFTYALPVKLRKDLRGSTALRETFPLVERQKICVFI